MQADRRQRDHDDPWSHTRTDVVTRYGVDPEAVHRVTPAEQAALDAKAPKPATATVKPSTATAVSTPAQAAQKIAQVTSPLTAKSRSRVIEAKGAKSATEVQQRIMAALEEELPAAADAAGFKTIRIEGSGPKGSKFRGRRVFADDQYVGDIDTKGKWHRASQTAVGGKTTKATEARAESGAVLRDVQAGLTPSDLDAEVMMTTAAALGRHRGAGRLVVSIPGDGTFAIENNPHAIRALMAKIKSGGPSPWKGLK
jgi:hypothetical protein